MSSLMTILSVDFLRFNSASGAEAGVILGSSMFIGLALSLDFLLAGIALVGSFCESDVGTGVALLVAVP